MSFLAATLGTALNITLAIYGVYKLIRGVVAAINVMKKARNFLEKKGLILQTASNRKGVFGLLRQAGQFVLGMFSAGAKAPFPANIILPFILGAVAGGISAALIAKFSKGDDIMSGYGKRTLLLPEGAIALNNRDTVIAGTNLFKGDDIVSAPPEGVTLNTTNTVNNNSNDNSNLIKAIKEEMGISRRENERNLKTLIEKPTPNLVLNKSSIINTQNEFNQQVDFTNLT